MSIFQINPESPSSIILAGLQAYVSFYESLTSANVEQLRGLVIADVHFRDPFNDHIGVDKMIHAFRDMFVQCNDPRFVMLDVVTGSSRAVLKWEFLFTPKSRFFNGGMPVNFIGLSELVLNSDGKVVEHLDYWDAAREFHERIPVIGSVLRNLRGRLAV